ncbi:hypothetical protein FB45DRAFT_913120 [Roridomyces roridus]|uniref:Uncharacterized protein n=1 Tax=Roridomyces roridus TaxID=1738132 RepID=A0AAD7BWI6_9AGAR|nr:hypothetical protein FB45DRAFT_913120 [Roridomyces roridus]
MLLSPASTSASLPQSFWGKFKPKGKEDMRDKQSQMALARQRLLTLAYGDMETIRMLPGSFGELESVAREWTKPPPDAVFSLRVPVEFASLQAALTGEDSYQIAVMGVSGLRVEIVSDAPPPPDEPPTSPLDVTVSSDELDMARMEDGTMVDGMFWGKLDIVHAGDTHKMEFSGTRLANENYSPEFMFDSRVMTKLAVAAKPTTAKCHLSNKVKYFLRVHPGGALEHFESEMVATSLYYEAMPDPGMVDPNDYIAPRNGFAMSFRDFVPHLMNVLDQLGMSLHARTSFISNNISAFSAHKNIAYRFLSPSRIAAAIDISVTHDPCIFTRLFLIFRGLSDDDVGIFAGAGEKEANAVNWREVVGWSEDSKDPTMFRLLETSVLEVT